MRGLRCSFGLLLAAVWIAPLYAQEAGTIRGRVTDESSQLPIRGAVVTYQGKSTETRPDGGYVLADVPAGTDSVHVAYIGYAPAARPVTVVGGQAVSVDVAMAAQALNLSAT